MDICSLIVMSTLLGCGHMEGENLILDNSNSCNKTTSYYQCIGPNGSYVKDVEPDLNLISPKIDSAKP